MGNRFATLSQYNKIILGHGILAVITFLFLVPIAILMSQFYTASPFWALRIHIYLQTITILLSTVVFTLGWFAVGPSRSFTNPHHGIGLAIYVSILVQALLGASIHRIFRKRIPKRLPLSLMLHQWLGKSTAILGFAQVALGLTLYGSPKFTFVLYAVWMALLFALFFFLNYRARPVLMDSGRDRVNDSLPIIESKSNPAGSLLGSYSVGAGAVTTLPGSIERNRERSQSRGSRLKTTMSRRDSLSGSESHVIDEKRRDEQKKAGLKHKFLQMSLLIGLAGLTKSRLDKKKKKEMVTDGYSTVTPNIRSKPSRRHHDESQISEETYSSIETEETPRRISSTLPESRNLATSTALGASERLAPTSQAIHDRDSYDSESYSEDLTASLKTEKKSQNFIQRIVAPYVLGFITKKLADKLKKDVGPERTDKNQVEDKPATKPTKRFSGKRSDFDSYQRRPKLSSSSSDISSIRISHDSESRGPNLSPSSLIPGPGPNTLQSPTEFGPREYIQMPKMPPDPQGILHQDSVSSLSRNLPSQKRLKQDSSIQRAETETIKRAAVGEEYNHEISSQVTGAPASISDAPGTSVSVKVKLHDDKNHITLRRLTREEAAAEREARIAGRRHRRAESVSSLSGIETTAAQRRYRRSDLEIEKRTESLIRPTPVPGTTFSSSRKPTENTIIPGKPEPGKNSILSAGHVGSAESYETWSAMSPGNDDQGEAAAERRRRRRLERSQRSALGSERISEKMAS